MKEILKYRKIKFIKIFIQNENGMPRTVRIYTNHKENLILNIVYPENLIFNYLIIFSLSIVII
jgi:hypothetical protein